MTPSAPTLYIGADNDGMRRVGHVHGEQVLKADDAGDFSGDRSILDCRPAHGERGNTHGRPGVRHIEDLEPVTAGDIDGTIRGRDVIGVRVGCQDRCQESWRRGVRDVDPSESGCIDRISAAVHDGHVCIIAPCVAGVPTIFVAARSVTSTTTNPTPARPT